MDPLTEVELGFLLIPLAGFVYGLLEEWHKGRSPPAEVVAVDDPGFGGMPTMVSHRWGLTGRPDELRRLPDGTIIPVEIKACRSPRSGVPYPSHRIQLLSYCALVEEIYGPPPYGILAYGDGIELHIAWDVRARADIFSVLERVEGHARVPRVRPRELVGSTSGRAGSDLPPRLDLRDNSWR